MKTTYNLVLVGLFIASTIGGMSQVSTPNPDVPKSWKKIDARGRFSFYVPPDMKSAKVQGIDSYVGQYSGKNIQLEFDYGPWSTPFQDGQHPRFVSETNTIAGKNAILVSYYDSTSVLRYIAGIHFPSVNNDGRTKLSIIARCRREVDREVAWRIFISVSFP